MNYLITASGRGTRFLSKGLKPPKPLIKVFGNELLIWSMNSFEYKFTDKVFIVTFKEHKVKEILENKIRNLFPDIAIFWLEMEEILEGQLLTAIHAIKYFKIQGPITIHNCDTFHKFDIEEINNLLNEKIFGIIPCFKGEGNHWSFAKTKNSDSLYATEVKEKVRISDKCSVGTYVFSSTNVLLEIFNEYFINENCQTEYFIAPIYQYAIEKKLTVIISKANYVKIFGTVSELLNSFGISFYELLGENASCGHQKRTLVVDIDNTICEKNEDQDYSHAIPIKKACNALRNANSQGVYIILYTSRNLRSFKGSFGLINKYTAPILIEWLNNNKIPFDEIYFGKPWGNEVSYIDDKSLLIENFIKYYSN